MQYFKGLFYQNTPNASISDITPPTFLGINNITALPNGSIRAEWSAGTDATNPIRYEVYVHTSTVGLFNLANIAYVSYEEQIDVYQLADQSRLQKNVLYYIGIRAVDAVGNRETNTTSMSATSTGVLDDDLATIAASLVTTESNLEADADRIENAANLILSTVV